MEAKKKTTPDKNKNSQELKKDSFRTKGTSGTDRDEWKKLAYLDISLKKFQNQGLREYPKSHRENWLPL